MLKRTERSDKPSNDSRDRQNWMSLQNRIKMIADLFSRGNEAAHNTWCVDFTFDKKEKSRIKLVGKSES